MKKTVLFAAVTVVAFVLSAEIVLRLSLPPLPSRPFEWPPPDMTQHGLMPDDHLFWKMRPNYDQPWRLFKLAYTHELAENKEIDWQARKSRVARRYAGVTWQVNAMGLRGVPVSSPKKKDTIRLLFLGSSITFGWGVKADEAFPEGVRRALEADYPGVSFETVNAGVPGYSSHQGLRYLEMLLPGLEPDIVVAEFGINDGTSAVGREDKNWEPGRLSSTGPWLRNTGWARLVLRIFPAGSNSAPVQDVRQTYEEARENYYRISMTGHRTRVSPSDFRTNLERTAALCAEAGAGFFTLIPCLYNEYGRGELISSVAFQAPGALMICEALSACAGGGVENLFLPYDEAHLAPAGHGLVARSLTRLVKPYVERLSG